MMLQRTRQRTASAPRWRPRDADCCPQDATASIVRTCPSGRGSASVIGEIEAFAEALGKASRAAANTVKSYRHDLADFNRYLMERAPSTLDEKRERVMPAKITVEHVRGYLADVMRHASRATVQRRLFAIKAYFRWRTATKDVENPVRRMRSIKIEKRLPQVIGEKEATRLVEAEGDMHGPAALRD